MISYGVVLFGTLSRAVLIVTRKAGRMVSDLTSETLSLERGLEPSASLTVQQDSPPIQSQQYPVQDPLRTLAYGTTSYNVDASHHNWFDQFITQDVMFEDLEQGLGSGIDLIELSMNFTKL